jgi:hypothetical protein
MVIFNSMMRRAVLALAMLCGSGQLLASPVYHVSVDTSTLSGQSGYLDFLFTGLANASPAHATLSNFSGDFGVSSFVFGEVNGSVGSSVVIGNGSGWNELGQWANFGGRLRFDVEFDVGPGAGAGTDLGIALLDDQFQYLGVMGNIATFALQPGAPDQVALVSQFAQADTNAVPEPSTLLQLASGCLMLFGLRRKAGR